jgi:steroid delta-isomerase-like uncharacterized protein
MRADRFDDRTAAKVATASTSVPTAVASEDTVAQSMAAITPRPLHKGPRRAPQEVGVSAGAVSADDGGMQTAIDTETNKALVRDFIDALFTNGDLAAVDRFLAPDFVDHDPPFGGPGGREGIRAAGAQMRQGCPDWHSDLHSLVAEDDIVVERFTASGTHQGEMFGVAPSGEQLVLRGINIFRICDGKIVERWGRLDELGVLQQLGLAG